MKADGNKKPKSTAKKVKHAPAYEAAEMSKESTNTDVKKK